MAPLAAVGVHFAYSELDRLALIPYVCRFASVSCYNDDMSLAYADEAIRIRRLAPLTERDIARATGAGVSTVSAWLHRTRAPTGRRAERLVELSAIIDRLATVLEAEYVPVWLNRPLVALGHRKPIDVLADGGYEEISRLVAALESPTFT
jgi:transcriptional regulator with XRE-family HTH domain